jgi:methionyl aminopeptidase
VRPYDLDLLARDMIADAGAASSLVGYHPTWSPRPYPAVICSSVNDAVVHGIPNRTPLEPGDPLSVDCAVHLDGRCADAAFSVVVGDAPDPRDLALVDATERALYAGIDGWTLRTADGSRAAHAEHTIAVTAAGPRILTSG